MGQDLIVMDQNTMTMDKKACYENIVKGVKHDRLIILNASDCRNFLERGMDCCKPDTEGYIVINAMKVC